jgi:hypothetical protein
MPDQKDTKLLKICPFPVNYESVMFCSKGPRSQASSLAPGRGGGKGGKGGGGENDVKNLMVVNKKCIYDLLYIYSSQRVFL